MTGGDQAAATRSQPAARPGTIRERGRAKAFRPLDRPARRAALERGLAAYERGAWYLAHEELEPAWMGTDDQAERALIGGLIKLAAAGVHAERGNPRGVRTNLRGARERLRDAAASPDLDALGLDLGALLGAVEERLDAVDGLVGAGQGAGAGGGPADPTRPARSARSNDHDVVGPSSQVRGAPVPVSAPPLHRSHPA